MKKDLTLAVETVSKSDIKAIKVGTKKTFTLLDRKKISTIRNTASIIPKEESSLGVVYSCSADYEKSQITITAKSSRK